MLPQGGLTLYNATVLFQEGMLQVRSPVSYTLNKGKTEEATDRTFKFKVSGKEMSHGMFFSSLSFFLRAIKWN